MKSYTKAIEVPEFHLAKMNLRRRIKARQWLARNGYGIHLCRQTFIKPCNANYGEVLPIHDHL